MDKSKIEDEIFYGDHAETLLSNPAFQAAMTKIKLKIFDQFGSTGIFQRRKREELWKMKRVIESFEEELQIMINDGNLAKRNMKNDQKLKSV